MTLRRIVSRAISLVSIPSHATPHHSAAVRHIDAIAIQFSHCRFPSVCKTFTTTSSSSNPLSVLSSNVSKNGNVKPANAGRLESQIGQGAAMVKRTVYADHAGMAYKTMERHALQKLRQRIADYRSIKINILNTTIVI